jgi:hypothetical protein
MNGLEFSILQMILLFNSSPLTATKYQTDSATKYQTDSMCNEKGSCPSNIVLLNPMMEDNLKVGH